MKFAMGNSAVQTQENIHVKITSEDNVNLFIFDLSGTAIVGASHKDQGSIGPIVQVS